MCLYFSSCSFRNSSGSNYIIFVAACSKFRYLIVIVAQVVLNVPCKVSCRNWFCIDCYFKAFMLKRADIAYHSVGEVSTRGNRYFVKQVVWLTVVSFDRTRYSVVKKSEINTYVIGSRFFPFQICVISAWTVCREVYSVDLISFPRLTVNISRYVRIITLIKILLTGYTISGAKLKFR